MLEWLKKVYLAGLRKTEYVPLWQDDKLLYPSEYSSNEFIIDNNLEEKFVIQYSGNMGLWNEMETMGKAVRENLKDVVFHVCGRWYAEDGITEYY